MAFVFEIHIHTYNKSSMIYWIINEASLALIYVIVILLRVFRCCLHHMPGTVNSTDSVSAIHLYLPNVW
jgi:hypothetical protein